MGPAQIIYIVLLALGVGVSLSKHGEQKTGTYGFTEWLIAPAIVVGLLYWGGFFG